MNRVKKKRVNSILSTVDSASKDQRPVFELDRQQKEQLRTVASITLGLIAAAGVITLGAITPNVLVAIDKIHRLTKRGKVSFKEKQAKAARTFYYLKRHGLIQIESGGNGLIARLTSKGRLKMEELSISTLRIKKPKKWDGKWWLVAADVPSKDYRWAADLFRNKIKQMGFYSLQRTLWLYPYNPIGELEYLTNYFTIGRFVTVMEVSRMDKDDEQKLKKFFGF